MWKFFKCGLKYICAEMIKKTSRFILNFQRIINKRSTFLRPFCTQFFTLDYQAYMLIFIKTVHGDFKCPNFEPC
jgi:hypothetical protein